MQRRGWLSMLSLVALLAVALSDASSFAADSDADAAAFEFARKHHPELAGLLDQLRMNAPKEYQAAISDLNRSRERLDKTRDRLPERYDLELAEWKLNSRIRLLAARLAMGDDADLEAELRSVLKDRAKIRVKLLEDERDRTAKRLGKLDEQIAEQRSQVDKLVERELAVIQKDVSNTAAKAAKTAKARESGIPAAKPSPSKVDPKKPDVKKTESKPSTPSSSDKPKSKNVKPSDKK